jgi:hypothetical protein
MEKSKKEFLKLNIVLMVVFSAYSLAILMDVFLNDIETNVFLPPVLIIVFLFSFYFLVKDFKELVEA